MYELRRFSINEGRVVTICQVDDLSSATFLQKDMSYLGEITIFVI